MKRFYRSMLQLYFLLYRAYPVHLNFSMKVSTVGYKVYIQLYRKGIHLFICDYLHLSF